MKVDIDLIREAVKGSLERSLLEVQDEPVLADIHDKFFNFGVYKMFYETLTKLDEIEKIAKEVSA